MEKFEEIQKQSQNDFLNEIYFEIFKIMNSLLEDFIEETLPDFEIYEGIELRDYLSSQ